MLVRITGVGDVEEPPGRLALEVLRDVGAAVDVACVGNGTCGRCRVRFLSGAPDPGPEDRVHVGAGDLAAGWRLACRARPERDCTLALPQGLDDVAIAVDTAGVAAESVGEPSGGRGSAGGGARLGVAVDLGTTTVVVYLLDVEAGVQLGVSAFRNPQVSFGPDVISRIRAAHSSPAGLGPLRGGVLGMIEGRVLALCGSRGADPDAVGEVMVVGNPTMLHVLAGVDPWPLGVAPYRPVFTERGPVTGAELGFGRLTRVTVRLGPAVDGHVGADVLGGLVALEVRRRPGPVLLGDLGTNGEIVLVHEAAAVATSCAAGPALEGGGVSAGMAALPGAVERVAFDATGGGLELSTIGGAPPRGLCGSGLLDAVALLLRHGVVAPSGRMAAPGAPVPADLGERLGEDDTGRHFFLVREGGEGRPVTVTQEDVRSVQLAKAAVRVGVDAILETTGLRADDLRAVYLAGAFGSAAGPDSVIDLGILPEACRGKVQPVGNVAGLGAKRMLCHAEDREEARRLAAEISGVDLAAAPDFDDRFVAATAFPGPG